MKILDIDPLEWALSALGLALAAIIYVRRIKTHGPPRYAPATPRQKAVCVVLLVAMLASWAIDYVGWRPFDGYEKQVAIIVSMICVLYVSSLATMLEHR